MDFAAISALILGLCQLLINLSACAILCLAIVLTIQFPKAVNEAMAGIGRVDLAALTPPVAVDDPPPASPRARRRASS